MWKWATLIIDSPDNGWKQRANHHKERPELMLLSQTKGANMATESTCQPALRLQTREKGTQLETEHLSPAPRGGCPTGIWSVLQVIAKAGHNALTAQGHRPSRPPSILLIEISLSVWCAFRGEICSAATLVLTGYYIFSVNHPNAITWRLSTLGVLPVKQDDPQHRELAWQPHLAGTCRGDQLTSSFAEGCLPTQHHPGSTHRRTDTQTVERATEYYLAIKNELLGHVSTWIDGRHSTLTETSWAQKSTHYVFLFIRKSTAGKANLWWLTSESGWGEGELLVEGHKETFWGDGNVLYFVLDGGYAGIFNYQNSVKWTLKICGFYCIASMIIPQIQ